MIPIRKIRDLALAGAPQAGRLPFLTAASGLVRTGNFLYLIADDENYLAAFREGDPSPGTTLPLFPGELPVDKKSRKRAKPDLEALVLLPADAHAPFGALLALPSGSKPNRVVGAIVPLDAQGAVAGAAAAADLRQLFTRLDELLTIPNIESAAIVDGTLYLIHRGNKGVPENALIAIRLETFLASVRSGAPLAAGALGPAVPIALGDRRGVPFTVTDAVALDGGRLAFTAVAENTDDSYEDGQCLDAGVGVIDVHGKVLFFDTVEPSRKLEGIAARPDEGRWHLSLVNDEDDHSHPSALWTADIPAPA